MTDFHVYRTSYTSAIRIAYAKPRLDPSPICFRYIEPLL